MVDRKQCVVLSGALSDWCLIKAGVPRGSTLGLMLFLVIINNTVEDTNSSIGLVVDDTSLYIVVDDSLDSAIKLNTGPSRIDMWASMLLVSFNLYKFE